MDPHQQDMLCLRFITNTIHYFYYFPLGNYDLVVSHVEKTQLQPGMTTQEGASFEVYISSPSGLV